MRAALGEYRIDGIKTNIPLHQRVLRDHDFLAGKLHTRYLDQLLERMKTAASRPAKRASGPSSGTG